MPVHEAIIMQSNSLQLCYRCTVNESAQRIGKNPLDDSANPLEEPTQ